MTMKKDKIERIIKGIKHVVYPKDVKQNIVREIESGAISVKEAQLKYGIHQAYTIQTWLKEYSEEYRTNHMRVIYTDAQRRTAVREIESGHLHIEAAIIKYRVSRDTLKDWLKAYSCESNTTLQSQEMVNKTDLEQETTKAQKQAIEELKLKVAALEALIDIAEKELHIDIRKKSGTKQ